jgi:hypothetical protein
MSKSCLPVIVAVSGDPGGAAALVPVVKALDKGGRYRVASFTYRQASGIWSRHHLASRELCGGMTEDQAIDALCREQPSLLLTATSMNTEELEKKFIAAAQILGIPSLAVLDFWSNYRYRFADQEGRLAYLPDRVAVMDEQAYQEMIEAGFPQDSVVITGQPALDELAQVRDRCGQDRRNAVRAQLGLPPDHIIVLFASQPLKELFGDNVSNPFYPGFTEMFVLVSLVQALERIALRSGLKIALLVRPHPREDLTQTPLPGSEIIRIIVSCEGDGREVSLASDFVTGMNSMLLVEACFLGCPVLSMQPGLIRPDALPTNRIGLTRAIYRESEIEPALEELVLTESARQELAGRAIEFPIRTDSTLHVVALCESMAQGGIRDKAGD